MLLCIPHHTHTDTHASSSLHHRHAHATMIVATTRQRRQHRQPNIVTPRSHAGHFPFTRMQHRCRWFTRTNKSGFSSSVLPSDCSVSDSHRVQFAARAAHSSPRECAVDIYAVGRRVCVLNTNRTTHDKNEVKRQKNVP